MPFSNDEPITCAGVYVEPGDIIVGDAEGAVVIPHALAEEVARDAVEQERREAFAIDRVKAGESSVDVFPLSKERQPTSRHGPGGGPEHRRRSVTMAQRRSIEIDGLSHLAAIPVATRIGPLLVSSVIVSFDPGTRKVPAETAAQVANIYTHVGKILAEAGRDVGARREDGVLGAERRRAGRDRCHLDARTSPMRRHALPATSTSPASSSQPP